jgi:hypothetical protein
MCAKAPTNTHKLTHTTCSEALKQIHTNTHTYIAPRIANILVSVNFWTFMQEKYLSAVPILNEYQENTGESG